MSVFESSLRSSGVMRHTSSAGGLTLPSFHTKLFVGTSLVEIGQSSSSSVIDTNSFLFTTTDAPAGTTVAPKDYQILPSTVMAKSSSRHDGYSGRQQFASTTQEHFDRFGSTTMKVSTTVTPKPYIDEWEWLLKKIATTHYKGLQSQDGQSIIGTVPDYAHLDVPRKLN